MGCAVIMLKMYSKNLNFLIKRLCFSDLKYLNKRVYFVFVLIIIASVYMYLVLLNLLIY